jgi:hypothetical protein
MNLQRFAINERSKAKKKGIEEGKSRIRVKDYSVVKMYEFLIQAGMVSNILGMSLGHCAFVLWAGKYEFFSVNDFKRDIPNPPHSYYSFINYFKSKNLITFINKENKKNQYALNASGINLFNKIDKFTKKHFNE